eukprot:6437196-Amphidinium_carterae.1
MIFIWKPHAQEKQIYHLVCKQQMPHALVGSRTGLDQLERAGLGLGEAGVHVGALSRAARTSPQRAQRCARSQRSGASFENRVELEESQDLFSHRIFRSNVLCGRSVVVKSV